MYDLLSRLANRQLERSASARAAARDLEGASLVLRLSDVGLVASIEVLGGALRIGAEPPEAPAAELTGALPAMLGLLGEDGERALRSGRIGVRGDGQVLAGFRRLLRLVRPDVEEELSGLIGDVGAHQLGSVLRGLAGWGRRSMATLWQDVGEFLQEEARDVPSRAEADEFMDGVDRLRADVERLEARIARFAARGEAR